MNSPSPCSASKQSREAHAMRQDAVTGQMSNTNTDGVPLQIQFLADNAVSSDRHSAAQKQSPVTPQVSTRASAVDTSIFFPPLPVLPSNRRRQQRRRRTKPAWLPKLATRSPAQQTPPPRRSTPQSTCPLASAQDDAGAESTNRPTPCRSPDEDSPSTEVGLLPAADDHHEAAPVVPAKCHQPSLRVGPQFQATIPPCIEEQVNACSCNAETVCSADMEKIHVGGRLRRRRRPTASSRRSIRSNTNPAAIEQSSLDTPQSVHRAPSPLGNSILVSTATSSSTTCDVAGRNAVAIVNTRSKRRRQSMRTSAPAATAKKLVMESR